MGWIAGVDGCRAGWFAVFAEHQDQIIQNVNYQLCTHFKEILDTFPLDVIGIDIPIGLLDSISAGGRSCDREARKLLKGGRAGSVFSPPVRPILNAIEYEAVRPYGLTKQAFHLLPKIREVDSEMTPALQERVCEVHPEVSFKALAGREMAHSKKTAPGRQERIEALKPIFPGIEVTLQTVKIPKVATDDIIDAHVAAWTAVRIAARQAVRIPEQPQTDSKGLRMEIWY